MTSTNRQQADSRTFTRAIKLVGLALAGICVTGCPSPGLPSSATFSETELVAVGDGVSVEVALGAGAPSLADSTWAIHKASDDSLLFRIVFGSNGEAERLFDSFVFASEWLGPDIIPDTQAHSTAFPGGSYVSGAYTAEQDGNVGVLGIVHGLLLGAHLGTATLGFSGLVVGNRIDGSMVRTVTIFADTPFTPPGDAVFDAYALREQ